jgi:hypothetical protein
MYITFAGMLLQDPVVGDGGRDEITNTERLDFPF